MGEQGCGAGDEIARCFAANLIRIRGARGITQEALAFQASLHRTEVGQLERGVRIARIDTLVKLAGALGIAPVELLAGIRWEPGSTRTGGWRLPASWVCPRSR